MEFNGMWSSQIKRTPFTTPRQPPPLHVPQNPSFHPNLEHHHYCCTVPQPLPQPEEQNPSYYHHSIPTTLPSYSSFTSLPHQSYHNPNPSPLVRIPWEHGVPVPYSSSSSSSYHSYPYPSTAEMTSCHHLGTGVGGEVGVDCHRDFPTKEAISQFSADPLVGGIVAITSHSNLLEQAAPIHLDGVHGTNKGSSKVVHTAYCEVCKIHCNSSKVLQSHRYGKNHRKNLEKLRLSLMPNPPKTTEPALVNENKSAKRKSGIFTAEDLEKKKKKVLEGGAAADAVKSCTICNVVCNSEIVFEHHITGKKHVAMVKKQQQSLSSLLYKKHVVNELSI